MLQKTDRKF